MMNFELLAKSKNLTVEQASRAFTLAMETALKEQFELENVHVDLDEKIVEVVFRIPIDMDFREALVFDVAVLHADHLAIVFDMKAFPVKFINRVKTIFTQTLDLMKNEADFKYWSKKIHRLVEGVIKRYSDENVIEVDLNGQTGYFHKRHWVPREKNKYQPGTALMFYVSAVDRNQFKIYLSRKSPMLPALMLKHQYPWHTFVCKKRWIGNKSFIFTDAPLDKKFADIRDEISDMLNGEILEVRGMKYLKAA